MIRFKTNKSKHQFALFVIFLAGLFALQIVFAFTTHGDISPHREIIQGIKRTASPVLIGRTDGIISDLTITSPAKVMPEAALAPATRKFSGPSVIAAKIDTDIHEEPNTLSVKKTDGKRFAEYHVCRGDTLAKISQKLFGNTRMVKSLVRINRIKNEKAIRLGATLKVPCNGLLKAVTVTAD